MPLRILNLLAACLALPVASWLPAYAQTAPPHPRKKHDAPKPVTVQGTRKGRETIVLDGAWTFRTDANSVGEADGWQKAPPAGTLETAVPALWTARSAPGFSGTAWYWREFDPPRTWKSQTVRLRFEAVAERASVWVNGERVAEHEGGATPFESNITKRLRLGERNLIAVRVEGDAERGAGIWQGVLIFAHDEAYIADVALSPGGLGQLSASIALENSSENTGAATLEGRVVGLDRPDREIHHSAQNLLLTPGRNITTMLATVRGKNLRPWSLESPFLYALQLAFRQGTDVLDTQETSFGFREFGWKSGAITLNGQPITIVSSAPAFPLPIVVASTDDAARARAAFVRLKAAGVNLLYLDAPSPELLRITDEIGVLVVESPRAFLAPDAAYAELGKLITRDRSHPSVLGWRLRSEDAVRIAALRAGDPSRFLLGVGAQGARVFAPGAGGGAVSPPPGLLPAP